jgi:hypothetical protein
MVIKPGSPSCDVVVFDFFPRPVCDEHGDVVLIGPEGRDITWGRRPRNQPPVDLATGYRHLAKSSLTELVLRAGRKPVTVENGPDPFLPEGSGPFTYGRPGGTASSG